MSAILELLGDSEKSLGSVLDTGFMIISFVCSLEKFVKYKNIKNITTPSTECDAVVNDILWQKCENHAGEYIFVSPRAGSLHQKKLSELIYLLELF